MKLDFDSAVERRILANGLVIIDVVRVGTLPVLRVAHDVGWRWSQHSAPTPDHDGCSNVHVGVMVSGRMMVELRDGTRYEAGPGDALAIPAGHDAWTLGDQPAVLIQFDEGDDARVRYGF